MNITDKAAIRILKKLNSCDVREKIYTYPEEERDGRSDMQMVADEAGYILSMYEENGTTFYDDLKESRYILNRTQYGKQVPLWVSTLKPVYAPSDIQAAKDVVNEYNRLKRLIKRLSNEGYYSQWY